MVIAVCIILGLAICCIMLSFVPWVQENMQWMTSFKFFLVMGAVISSMLLVLIKRVGDYVVKVYGN